MSRAIIRKLYQHLGRIGREYHASACPEALVSAVVEAGFPASALDGIYCGADGRTTHELSPKLGLVHVWHRMDSGRYEVTCYTTPV
jgi:hypothetical protein